MHPQRAAPSRRETSNTVLPNSGARGWDHPIGRRHECRRALRALSGRTHALYSAVAFVQDGKVLFEHIGIARLTMRTFSDRFLDDYLDAVGEAAMASVGAYQLEGIGVQLFDHIEGDYFTVLGLPLLPALDFLRQSSCHSP